MQRIIIRYFLPLLLVLLAGSPAVAGEVYGTAAATACDGTVYQGLCLPRYTPHFPPRLKDPYPPLFIIESHGAAGDNVIWKTAQGLPLKIAAPAELGTNGVTDTVFASATDALNAFNGFAADNYTKAVAAYLAANGFSYARADWLYSFSDAGDSNTPKQILRPLIIYPDGRVRDLGSRVITSVQRVLYYVYHSLATADNLPANWSYLDGGILYKYVLDQGLNIISSTTVNTNGAYDPPVIQNGVSTTNADQGLESLISQVVMPEMQHYRALYAMIDYGRSVSPAYNCDSTGKCTAVVAVQSLSRTLGVTDTGTTYTNTGNSGYILHYQTDRYIVQPDGSDTKSASSTGYEISPTQPFNKSVVVDSSTTVASLANIIIDPFTTSNLYDYTNDTQNNIPCNQYVYTQSQCAQAPITMQ